MNWTEFFDVLYKLLTRREQDALREIRREYETVVKGILSDMGVVFSRIGEDGKLDYADIAAYNRMKRIQERAIAQATRLGKFNRTTIDKLLDESYQYSYGWMSYGIEQAVERTLANATPSLPELLVLNEANGIDKLRLTESLEKSRRRITTDIQAAIEQGFIDGQDFNMTAKRIQRVFEMDYNRALMIAETEVHRIREKGTNDSAQNASGQGIEMEKVWNNVGDERVRKSYKANHRVLHGQRRTLDELFDLGQGVSAKHPGASGTPQNDIRCRCYARYEVRGVRQIGVREGQQQVTRDFEAWRNGK